MDSLILGRHIRRANGIRFCWLLFLAVFFLEPVGCARIESLHVKTYPAGAKVYVNDSFICSSPCKVPLRPISSINPEVKISVVKEGYNQIDKYVQPRVSVIDRFQSELFIRLDHKTQEPAEVALRPGPVIPSAASKTLGIGCYWAVVIGISSYKDSRIPALRYADRDAKEFYDWLISPNGGRHAPSCVKLLLNEDATARNIRTVLFSWLKQALKEDVVTIYFAGHGSPESPDSQENLFLFSYDTDYDVIASTAFPMWDLETALNRFITAEKVVIVMDACHAGGVGRSFDIARRDNRSIEVNPINTGLQGLSGISKGICVICASDEKQFSQEGIKWGNGHGVFTYFLLDGLSGAADYNHDRVVTLGELIQYVSEKVRRATANAQSPVVSGSFDPALGYGMR